MSFKQLFAKVVPVLSDTASVAAAAQRRVADCAAAAPITELNRLMSNKLGLLATVRRFFRISSISVLYSHL